MTWRRLTIQFSTEIARKKREDCTKKKKIALCMFCQLYPIQIQIKETSLTSSKRLFDHGLCLNLVSVNVLTTIFNVPYMVNITFYRSNKIRLKWPFSVLIWPTLEQYTNVYHRAVTSVFTGVTQQSSTLTYTTTLHLRHEERTTFHVTRYTIKTGCWESKVHRGHASSFFLTNLFHFRTFSRYFGG